MPVYANDVLVLDEASQFATADLVRLWQILEETGARTKPVGDTEQLGPVEAGGMFRLLAARHGNWKLTEVRRFAESWERAASLRLREGDVLALGEYYRHGRIYHGAADRMREEAVSLWLTDYLRGKDSLLMAGTNEEAAELARMAREQLVRAGPHRRAGPGHAQRRQPGRDRRPGPGPAQHEDRRGRPDAGQPGHHPDQRVARRGTRPDRGSRAAAAGRRMVGPVHGARGLPRRARRARVRRQRVHGPGPHGRRRVPGWSPRA